MKDAFLLADSTSAAETITAYPPFGARYLRAIELAVRRAWEQLLANPIEAAKLATGDEIDISHQLRTALNGLREQRTGEVSGYTCEIFERPQLGAEILSPTGLIRKPDLVFALAGPARPGVGDTIRDGIFVECKVLDATKGVAEYCKAGLSRFVVGHYGGWMREGMMLAYVRNRQKLPVALETLGKKKTYRDLLAWDGAVAPCGLTDCKPRVYLTVHQRAWPYLEHAGVPGPVEVRHLWLAISA